VRVVFVTHNYPRYTGDVAGSFLATLAQGLRGRGVDVRVVAPSDEGKGGEDAVDGVPVRRVRYASPSQETIAYRGSMKAALRGPGGWRALAGLWRALRRGAEEELAAGADLVHAHWWVPGGLAAPKRAPLVLTVHGTDVAILRRSRVARALARPVFQRARIVTAVSRELATAVQNALALHVPADHVQPMPVDADRFPWTEGGGGAVVVARLTTQKRVHLAVDAIATLAAFDHRLPLTVVGDGPERERLAARAAEHGIAGLVRFVGAVPQPRIPEYLANADLMFLPSAGEGFGLVAAEALMAGVPVIACWDGGGVLDIVPERGAGRLVIPAGEALADAALDVLQDPEAGVLAREEGERWRVRLSPDTVAERYERWYREALGAEARDA
jgi:glycosyltransferase involved in cell wall biosynthesis